jgi:hypothetical protein
MQLAVCACNDLQRGNRRQGVWTRLDGRSSERAFRACAVHAASFGAADRELRHGGLVTEVATNVTCVAVATRRSPP